ncbi:Flp pilus assembly protein CpaB [Azohydromonas sp. G-1-1-14]|uniref:Flp pilus assembly protein CpaB n=2 Tax=Azohydromonas caseinilytica TaxID=2728836 RepID=A0A848FA16_9BURK|nr:Flp pilus assembly protein CpaB [Azohydromonas caseinilytica]
MLAVALVAGLLAALFAARWLSTQSVGGGRIVVAALDVEVGAKIGPEALKTVEWPRGSEPPGAFDDPAKLQGRVARSSLTRGEPVLEGKLAPVGTKGGLSAVVQEGKRAMTVRVNDVVGVAGFALPGNYVDIMVNTQNQQQGSESRDAQDKAISKIVLERILVLAVAQEANRDDTKPKVVNAVTLELTPDQAEKLDLARSVGTLSLVLRNQVDPQPGGTAGATKDSLLQTVSTAAPVVVPRPVQVAPRRTAPTVAAPVQAPAPAQQCVEVIRGTTRTNECF